MKYKDKKDSFRRYDSRAFGFNELPDNIHIINILTYLGKGTKMNCTREEDCSVVENIQNGF